MTASSALVIGCSDQLPNDLRAYHLMNGWEFRHEQLRDDDLKDIPTIVVSALPPDRAAGGQVGEVDFVPKPPSLPRLLDEIGRASCRERV